MLRVLLSPRLIGVHLLAVVATGTAVWLGIWQYDAWATQREAAATDLADAPPRRLEAVMGPDQPFPAEHVGRPVTFSGEWVEESTFYVANRRRDGKVGYWVVTPVAVCREACASAPAMPVVRGWTATAEHAPPPAPARVEVTGWLQPPQGSGRQDPDPRDDVLHELRIADAIQHVDQDLYGAYVVAETPRTPDLEPVTPAQLPPASTFTGFRNLLYAAEWWVFGAFAAFVWWRWCRDRLADAEVPSRP